MTYAVAHLRMVDPDLSMTDQSEAPARVDLAEFEKLFHTHAPRLKFLAERKLGDPHLAEDAVQETFLRAFRSLDTFDPSRPALPWLTAICNNICIDHIRGRYASSEVLTEDAEVLGLEADPKSDPAEQFMAHERARGMGVALKTLCGRQKRVLMLKDLEGWSSEDIAALEGTSVQALKGALKRARKTFKRSYLAVASERGLSSLVLPVAGWFGPGLRSKLRRAVLAWKTSATAVSIQVISQAVVLSSMVGVTAMALLAVSGISEAGTIARAKLPAAGEVSEGSSAPAKQAVPGEVVSVEVSTPQLGSAGPGAAVSAGIGRNGEETLMGKVESKIGSNRGEAWVTSEVDVRCTGTVKKAACDAVDLIPSRP
jgi:RNA polymerase sigma factor (sigma-70 family)